MHDARLAALLLIGASCGRLDFEVHSDGAMADAPAACTTAPPHVVTSCPFACHDARLVWIGTSYVLCYVQESTADQTGVRETRCVHLDRDGQPLEPAVPVPLAGTPNAADLSFTGSELTFTYAASPGGDYEIFLSRLDPATFFTQSPVQLTSASGTSWGTSHAWSGSTFGFAYYDFRADPDPSIYIAVAPGDLSSLKETRVTMGFAAYGTSTVWTGSEFVVAWRDIRDGGNYDVYLQRFDTTGALLGSTVAVTDGTTFNSDPTLAWTGSSLATTYSKGPNPGLDAVCVSLADRNGNRIAPESTISSPPGPSRSSVLLPVATGFMIGWFEVRGGGEQAYFNRLDPNGVPIGPEVAVPGAPYATGTDSPPINLVRSDRGFGAAWSVGTSTDAQIQFVEVCP